MSVGFDVSTSSFVRVTMPASDFEARGYYLVAFSTPSLCSPPRLRPPWPLHPLVFFTSLSSSPPRYILHPVAVFLLVLSSTFSSSSPPPRVVHTVTILSSSSCSPLRHRFHRHGLHCRRLAILLSWQYHRRGRYRHCGPVSASLGGIDMVGGIDVVGIVVVGRIDVLSRRR